MAPSLDREASVSLSDGFDGGDYVCRFGWVNDAAVQAVVGFRLVCALLEPILSILTLGIA